MNVVEFTARLSQSEPGSPEAAALASELVEDAHYPANSVLQRYLTSSDKDDQIKAKNMLAELRDFAIVPLAESKPSPNIDNELWVVRTITDELLAFRSRAVSLLKDMLGNRMPASTPPEESLSFQVAPDTRVCDLALVLLHHMFHVQFSSSAFLGAPAVERDGRIKEFQNSPHFQATFENKS